MARYLLDTNIASYFMKATSPALDARFRHIPKHEVAISVITEAEIRLGVALVPKEAKIRGLAEIFLGDIDIVPWDSRCAQRFASLAAVQQNRGQTLSLFDTMIAAHALAQDLTLVTHDKAFARVDGLSVEDWTKGPQRA